MIYAATTTAAKKFPIKIGQAKSVKNRLIGLQTSCPYPLDDVRTFHSEISDSDVHFILGEYRERGEWFRAHDNVVRVLDRLPDVGFQRCIANIRALNPSQLIRLLSVLNCGSLGDLCNVVSRIELAAIETAVELSKHRPKRPKRPPRQKQSPGHVKNRRGGIDAQLRSTVAEALSSGWSMLALAEAAGVPRSSLREWYHDGKGLHSETLMQLTRFFGMRLTKGRVSGGRRNRFDTFT